MDSSPRRGRTGDYQEAWESHVESPTPHFFKIINRYSIQLGKICIPFKFVEKYGDELSGSVVLKVPNGDIWNIGLEENEEGLWLQRRWRKFVSHYSIRKNYLVTFCHEGESIFRVVIYNTFAAEIKYPASAQRPGPARTATAAPPNTRNVMPTRQLAAANFSSIYPYFWVLMTEKYARKGSVAISARFMVRNELTDHSQMVKLQHGDQKWSVKMYFYSSGKRGGSFCKGWIEFSKKNNIKQGDICVFELIKKKKVVFKVTILRGDE